MAPDVPCCTFLLIRCHNLSSGSTHFHRVPKFYNQVTNFAGDNLKYRVTLVPSGAGVVCHLLWIYLSISPMMTIRFVLEKFEGLLKDSSPLSECESVKEILDEFNAQSYAIDYFLYIYKDILKSVPPVLHTFFK